MKISFWELLNISFDSLKTNKLRSGLTMLGVVIGVMSVILLVSIGTGLQKYVTTQFESLGANLIVILPGKFDIRRLNGPPNFATSKLEVKDADSLVENSPLIAAAVPGTFTNALVKNGNDEVYEQIIGTTSDYQLVLNLPVLNGAFFSDVDTKGAVKVAVLGSKVAEKLFAGSDPIDQKVVIGDNRFRVIGVLKPKGGFGTDSADEQVFIPITVAKIVFGQDKVNAIYAQARNPEVVEAAIEDAKIILGNRLKAEDFTVINEKDILGAISSILGILTLALSGIAAISLVVGGIGIMNIMLVSVTERTREIGLRKALGATPNAIMVQFLVEALVLSVCGGVVGIILGFLGSLLINNFFPAEVTFWAVTLAFGISVGVGVVFGVIPARRAARLSPIEALRYE